MPAKDLKVDKLFGIQLLKIPLNIHKKAVAAISSIQTNPTSSVRLHGELANYYKFRIGDYRIIYSFDSKKSLVIILKIEHRQGVYK